MRCDWRLTPAYASKGRSLASWLPATLARPNHVGVYSVFYPWPLPFGPRQLQQGFQHMLT